jgi:hypothetical protein
MVRRSVDQTRTIEHASGISEPDRVPIRLDFACGGPAAAGATVKLLKGRRVQEERPEWLLRFESFGVGL